MGPSRSLFYFGLSAGRQLPSGYFHLLWHGILDSMGICTTVDLHRLQEHNVHHHGLHHGLQVNLCSSTRSTSSPSFFAYFGVFRVVSLTYSHSFLPASVAQQFLPWLEYVITEVLLLLLLGSDLASSSFFLELVGTGSAGHGGSFWYLLTACSGPTLPKPCYVNLICTRLPSYTTYPFAEWMISETKETISEVTSITLVLCK